MRDTDGLADMIETILEVPEVTLSCGLALALAWICVTDFRQFRIPDAASLGLIFLGLIWSFWSSVTIPLSAALGAALGYGTFAFIGSVYFRRTGEDGLGLGDAKLLAAAGAWLGWEDLPLLVAVSAASALAFAAMTWRRRVAFGPWLSAVFWTIWVVRVST